jgi:hypothetical protein
MSTALSALQIPIPNIVRFMACPYLKVIEQVYKVNQRTIRRWCERGRIPGAYRPQSNKQWRVRKPQDRDQWQSDVVKSLGEPPVVRNERYQWKGVFSLKLNVRLPYEEWPRSEKQSFGALMTEALIGLVRLNILEPAISDHATKYGEGPRLCLRFKSGQKRNQFENERVEELLMRALRDDGIEIAK